MTLSTVTVTGRILHPDNATACKGTVTFTPGSGLLVSSADDRILAGQASVTLAADGTFTIALPATDNAGTQPQPGTWNWGVEFHLYDATIAPFSFALPSSPSTVDLSALARVAPTPGTYIVVPGPAGPTGATGATGPAGPTGATGPQGAPGDAAALTRTVVSNNLDYTVQTTDRFIAITVLNAGMAVILPDPSTMPNRVVTVKDEAGMAALNSITVKPANPALHIDGDGTKQISQNYGVMSVYSNGAAWFTTN